MYYRRTRREMLYPTGKTGTIPVLCHANQTGTQVYISAEHGPQYRKPLSSRVDRGQTSVHHRPRTADRCRPSWPQSQCYGSDGIQTASLAWDHCCQGTTGVDIGQSSPITWTGTTNSTQVESSLNHPSYEPDLLVKFREVAPTTPKVIGAHVWNFKPNFKCSPLKFLGGTRPHLWCALASLGQCLAFIKIWGACTLYTVSQKKTSKIIFVITTSNFNQIW